MYLFSKERIKTYMFVLTLKCRLINSLTACVSLTFCSMIKFVNLFIQSFFTRNHFCGVQFCSGKIYFNVFVIHLEFCMYNLHNSYWFRFSLKFGLLCLMFWKVLCVFSHLQKGDYTGTAPDSKSDDFGMPQHGLILICLSFNFLTTK